MELDEAPTCHFTPMQFECGDSNDVGDCECWFICRHCGCIKDADTGEVVKQD